MKTESIELIKMKKLTTTIRVPQKDVAFWEKDGWTVIKESPEHAAKE